MKHWSSLPNLTVLTTPSLPRSLSEQSLEGALDHQSLKALSFSLGAKLGSGSSCTTHECKVDIEGGVSQLVLFRSPISSADERHGLNHAEVLQALQLPSDYSGQLDKNILKTAMEFCCEDNFEIFFPGASRKDLYKDVPHVLAESEIYGAVNGKLGAFVRKAEGYVPMHLLHKSAFTGGENHSAITKNLSCLMQDFSSSWRAMFLKKTAHTDAMGPNFGCTGLKALDQTSPRPRLAIIDVGSFEPCDDALWKSYFSSAIRGSFLPNLNALCKYEVCSPTTEKLATFYQGKCNEVLAICQGSQSHTPSQLLEKFDLFAQNINTDFD